MPSSSPRRMISLPMYDADGDAPRLFLAGLKSHLERLGLGETVVVSPTEDLDGHWLSPDLLLSQTCGYPLTTRLAGRVRLVGTPRYAAFGCEGGDYSSLIIVRQGDSAVSLPDLRGRRAAFNSIDSQSGYNALRDVVAPLADGGRFFADVVETGGHRRSIAAVLDGTADVAAIDCVSFALAQRHDPGALGGVRVLALSRPAPGLPLVTAAQASDAEIEALRAGFVAACTDPSLASAREALLLDGLDVRPDSDYDACIAMERRAVSLGYPVLA